MFEHGDDGGRDALEGPGDDGEFARLLAGEPAAAARGEPRAGEKITGRIIQIGETEAFVDCGGRAELPIATRELQNAAGELTVHIGDEVTAYVRTDGEQKYLSLAGRARGRDLAPLEEALRTGLPLTGTVKETNKGGFVIDLGGHRAFCPVSQIDATYVENPQLYIGQTFPFRVTEIGGGGRNIVVSRRAILREEIEARGAQTRRSLQVGDVRDGTVSRLMAFGAFVDIGGVEGLVHVSEISHARIDSPQSVLSPGQSVRVRVIAIQNLGQGRQERISLSIKALAGDPWAEIGNRLPLGTNVPGTVCRLMDYGAFIEVLPGVQGLVHVSELSARRIQHPREVVREGETVTVRILELDPARRRVSLSLKQAADEDDADDMPGT